MEYEYTYETKNLEEIFMTQGYFRPIPEVIFKTITESTLSTSARCLYYAIYMRANKFTEYSVKLSRKELAEMINKKIRSVHGYVKEIEEAGLLKITRNSKNDAKIPNTYTLTHPDYIANAFCQIPARKDLERPYLKAVK